MSQTHPSQRGPAAIRAGPSTLLPPVSPVSPGSQWARPNPHSNPQSTPGNSKTSQYIDKITSENDRLRRELRAEKLAREDEATRISAAKSKAEDSRAELQHLQLLTETHTRTIERKDRKLEEMKAAVLDGRSEHDARLPSPNRSFARSYWAEVLARSGGQRPLH